MNIATATGEVKLPSIGSDPQSKPASETRKIEEEDKERYQERKKALNPNSVFRGREEGRKNFALKLTHLHITHGHPHPLLPD